MAFRAAAEPQRALVIGSSLRCAVSKPTGHNYVGHNYVGHYYVGHDYVGHDYVGHN